MQALANKLAALAVLLGGVASCTSILALDDYKGAAGELCTLLARCYTNDTLVNCQERIEGALDSNHAYVASWLASFETDRCLESCNNARQCLDLRPVCENVDKDACARKEDCCGFSLGHEDCEAGACCRPRGVKCSGDGQCCGSAGACSPLTRTCGGVVCLDVDQTCIDNAQCCTGLCKEGHCKVGGCAADGFECAVPTDCCSLFCRPDGRCGESACGVEGVDCALSTECCKGLTCFVPAGSIRGTCSQEACLPLNADCVDGSQCCTNNCDQNFFVCASACHLDGDSCQDGGPCCSGACTNGVCAGACSTGFCTADSQCCPAGGSVPAKCLTNACQRCNAPVCSAMTAANPCASGPPRSQDAGCTTPCIDAVCKQDGFCCCTSWDELCVAEALMNASCICQ